MICICICDDDKFFLEILAGKIGTYLSSQHGLASKIYQFTDSTIFSADMKENVERYDLFLLDIAMPGLDGLELAAKLRAYKEDAVIIFLSGRTDKVYDAFEYDAFRFIPKDAMDTRLFRALDDAVRLVQKQDRSFFIHESKEGTLKIFYKNIMYISRQEKNVLFVMNGAKTLRKRMAMHEMAAMLPQDSFIAISRSHIVNLRHIQSVGPDEKTGKLSVLLENGERLPISHVSEKDVKRSVMEYWKER